MAVLKGLLYTLLETFAVPGTPPVFYRRFWPLIVLILVVVSGLALWSVGTDMLVSLVDAWLGKPSRSGVAPGVHVSLVVAGLAFIGFVLTIVNLVLTARGLEPLVFIVPLRLYSWISGVTALGVGLLIGISIFR